jgi:hypothetical protein
LAQEHWEMGMVARFLFGLPNPRRREWSEMEVDPDLEAAVINVMDNLFAMKPTVDEEGEPKPTVLQLTPRAKEFFIQFFNTHAKDQMAMGDDLAAAWSKLECYAARLALLVHCLRVAADDPTLARPDMVDEVSMEAGIKLSDWFGNEAKRVYSMLTDSQEETDRRELIDLINRQGGQITLRELMRSSAKFKTSEDAERALNDLVQAKKGKWKPPEATAQGGRPTLVFVLNRETDTDKT